MCRDPESLQEIGGTVVAQRLWRSHGADNDNRLVTADGQVQKVGSFFQGVSPGRHNDSGEVGRPDSSSLTRCESSTHWVRVSLLLGTLSNCSASATAYRSRARTDSISCSAVSRPPGRFEMVPPVAINRIIGSVSSV